MPLGDAVGDSVRAHLVADVEVGVFLSGGIDSTLITTYARDEVAALRTYTISFPEMPEIDESPLAEWNASALGTRHRTVPVTVAGLLGALDRFLDVNGEPAGDAAALPLTMLAREVAGDVKVVLTGEGADEMFGGYRRYDVSRYLDGRLVSAVGVVASPVADLVYRHRSDRPLDAPSRLSFAADHADMHRSSALICPRSSVRAPRATTLRALFLSDWCASAGSTRGREAARRFDLARWLPNTYLEKTDRATMAAGVEARTPFLDPAIAASLEDPALQFGKAGLRRLLCRTAAGRAASRPEEGLGRSRRSAARCRSRRRPSPLRRVQRLVDHQGPRPTVHRAVGGPGPEVDAHGLPARRAVAVARERRILSGNYPAVGARRQLRRSQVTRPE